MAYACSAHTKEFILGHPFSDGDTRVYDIDVCGIVHRPHGYLYARAACLYSLLCMHAMLSYESNKKGKLSSGEPSAENIPTRSGHLCSVHAPPPAAVTRATAAIAVYGTACCFGIYPYRFGMSLSNRLPTVLSQKGRICRIRANGL